MYSKYCKSKVMLNMKRAGMATALSGGLFFLTVGTSLADCATSQPNPLSMSSGICNDIGGTRENNTDITVKVTGGDYSGDSVDIRNIGDGEGEGGVAVSVSLGGTVTLRNGSTVTTSGDHGYGFDLRGGGSIDLDDVVITTDWEGADAITMQGDTAYALLNDVEITTHGASARGIRAQQGARVDGTNVSITTTNTNQVHYNDGSYGVWVEEGASVTLTDSTISTEGDGSSGVESWGAIFVGTRVTISTMGDGTAMSGVYVSGADGQVTLTDSSVSTTGDNVDAIFASEATVDLQDVRVSATGDGAQALFLAYGGSIDAVDSEISATGEGGSAIRMYGGDDDAPGLITITGGSLASTDAPLIDVIAGVGIIALNGPIELSPGSSAGPVVFASVTNHDLLTADLDLVLDGVSGATGLIQVTGAGNTLDVSLTDSQWAGDLEATGNTANVDLITSIWTGTATAATDITIGAGSTWAITGSSDAVLVTNAGRVAFEAQESTFSTLTTNDYIGDDGILVVNTVLDTDGSDSDRLIILGGTATGSTGIIVNNAGGGGALTVADGILLVDAVDGAATDSDAFFLAERAAAGSYEYLLFRGGSDDENDWFLRSFLIEEEEEVPLYRPEAPLYSPVPALARQLGLAYLGTLHERVGEQMNIDHHAESDETVNGVWGRVIGEFGSNSWVSSLDVSASGIGIVGVQGGVDLYRAEDDDGNRDHLGLYAAFARQGATIRGHALAEDDLLVGDLTMQGPAAGAYWTRYTESGGYVDAVVQANWFDLEATSAYDARLRTGGYGFVASLEVGQPIALAEGWQIEPQAQLIYQTVSVLDDADAFSTASWQAGDALTGRLGARLQFTSEDDDHKVQPYAKVNLWHGFGGTDHLTMGGSPSLSTEYGDTSLEVGAGFTARVSETASLYGHIDHRWSLDGVEERSSTQSALGVRVNW